MHVDPFDELIRELRAQGLPAAADSLAGIKASAWTTSSEMLGELGMAVLKIQAENSRTSNDHDSGPRSDRKVVRTRISSTAYRSAVGVALAAAAILVWLSLGVGIIGQDGDPANLMYFGVLAVGVLGAILARLRPHGMARALFATALAQALVAAIALIAGLGLPWSGPAEIVLLNGFFIAMFAGSAWLFRRAARRPHERSGA